MDLEPRTYSFDYCNDPCTTGLGDLTGITIKVDDGFFVLRAAAIVAAFVVTLAAVAVSWRRQDP